MKAGFIGLGRMGQAMARRLLEGGHDLGVYNRTAEKLEPVIGLGATALDSIKAASGYGEAVFTMLADDAAVLEVARKPAGLVESLPQGGIHICAGTHSVACIAELKERHGKAGQILLATPMLGRPEVVLSGQAGMVVAGAKPGLDRCQPLFETIARRTFNGGSDPVAAAAIKIANNFVLGCAIEAMGEGFALVRKYDVVPDIFLDVMTDGLFACSAYKIYGKIIAEQRYQPAGQRAVLGLKDANLALAAGEAVGVPLPSGNVWRDRLVGALSHGEAEHDWAVMAKDQARASGLE
jgi:3-hydroxyisobutyrate dehydrogenase-like beta-hydroxyacid dehydrogenase